MTRDAFKLVMGICEIVLYVGAFWCHLKGKTSEGCFLLLLILVGRAWVAK